jgi:threonine efflux protein
LSFSVAVSLLLIHLVLLVVPGQDFVTIARLSMSRSRRIGIAAAAGTATGMLFWALASVLGISALLADNTGLSHALRLGGALTLAGFGVHSVVQALRAKALEPLRPSARDDIRPPRPLLRGWATGLLSNLTNLKLLVFFSSIFSGFLPNDLPLSEKLLTALAMAALAFGWFSTVAILGSHPRVVRAYQDASRGMDVAFGLVFIGVGVLIAVRH